MIIILIVGILICLFLILQLIYTINKINYYNKINNIYQLPILKSLSTLSNKIKFQTYQTPLYIYNPSIQFDNNGRIIVVSRITGITFSENYSTDSDYITNNNIDNYFNIFGDYKSNASGIIKYNLQDYNFEIVNPFYSSKNAGKFEYQGFEDPRIFKFQDELWIITYFRGINEINNKFEHSIFIFSLKNHQNYLKLYYKKQNSNTNIFGKWNIAGEKNWMPFEFNNELYIVYSIFPHIILKVNLTTGECIEINKTKYQTEFFFKGGIGNGAPPQLFIQNNKKYFLGLGHTKNNYNGIFSQIRKNFFYIFEANPPFQILRVSPEFNILKKFFPIEYGSGLIN